MDKDCIIIFLILILIIALLNRRNDNKYIKDFQKYYKGIENNFKKENFYNLTANNRHQTSNSLPINTYSPSQTMQSSNNIGNIPYKVGAIAYNGDNKMYVNSINGIQIGDTIQINPKGENYEEKIVTGIGNNVLGLDSELKEEHNPNEPILNITNPDIQYGKIKNKDNLISRYAYINKQGRVNYSPTQETWDLLGENNITSEEGLSGIEKNNLYFI